MTQEIQQQEPEPVRAGGKPDRGGWMRRIGRWTFSGVDWFIPLKPIGKVGSRLSRLARVTQQFGTALRSKPAAETKPATVGAPRWALDVVAGTGLALIVIALFGAGLGVALGGITLLAVAIQQSILRSRSSENNEVARKRSE